MSYNSVFGTPGGIRTPDLMVRTHLLYPAELPGQKFAILVRVAGIEPAFPAWKAGILAVVLHSQSLDNYIRLYLLLHSILR